MSALLRLVGPGVRRQAVAAARATAMMAPPRHWATTSTPHHFVAGGGLAGLGRGSGLPVRAGGQVAGLRMFSAGRNGGGGRTGNKQGKKGKKSRGNTGGKNGGTDNTGRYITKEAFLAALAKLRQEKLKEDQKVWNQINETSRRLQTYRVETSEIRLEAKHQVSKADYRIVCGLTAAVFALVAFFLPYIKEVWQKDNLLAWEKKLEEYKAASTPAKPEPEAEPEWKYRF